MMAAAPGVPEAVKVTGLPLNPVAVAVTELFAVPAAVPSVQLVSVAMPAASVLMLAGLAGLVLPPPATTVNVTATPATGLLLTSVTFTEGGAATVFPAVALWLVAELAVMLVAGAVVPDAAKVTGLPLKPVAVAVRVLLSVPTDGPRVQLVSEATPDPLVLMLAGLAGLVAPPPAVTMKVTATPATGLLLASVTLTEGGAATAVPTVAL
jgi:hypothetical protein